MAVNGDMQYLVPTEEEFKQILSNIIATSNKVIPDNIIKLIPDDIEVTIESISTLNAMISNKIRVHNVQKFDIAIDIKFEDGQILHLASIQELISGEYLQEFNSCIERMTLTWNMTLKFNHIDLPQNHTLIVKLSNGLKPQEMFQLLFSGTIEDASQLETKFQPIVVQSVFMDRTFGAELVGVVEKWAKSVKRGNTFVNNKLILFLQKRPMLFAKSLRLITLLCIIGGSLRAAYSIIESGLTGEMEGIFVISNSFFMKIIQVSCWLIFVLMFSGRFANFISGNLFELVDSYGRSFIFSITQSDQKRSKSIQRENVYAILRFVFLIIFNIVVNIMFIFLEKIFF